MSKIGLDQAQLVSILNEGIVPGEPIDNVRLVNAIAKAIIRNNEVIEKQVPGVLTSKLASDLRRKGTRL